MDMDVFVLCFVMGQRKNCTILLEKLAFGEVVSIRIDRK
jgi:hypothetical protein